MKAAFDPAKNEFRFSCAKIPEIGVPVAPLGPQTSPVRPGFFRGEEWELLRDGKEIVLSLPNR